MTGDAEDPRCPECGEPIGQTATYCMHCSADLTAQREAADADDDGTWDRVETDSTVAAGSRGRSTQSSGPDTSSTVPGRTQAGVGRQIQELLGVGTATGDGTGDQLLDPDGLVDDTLTVAVGIVGGVVVGVLSTLVLAFVTGSGYALLFGLVGWLGATAYLSRRRTVQGAISRTGYAVAVAILSVPVIALSPAAEFEGGLAERGGLFVVLILFVAVPAVVAAAIGWIAGRYVPETDGGAGF